MPARTKSLVGKCQPALLATEVPYSMKAYIPFSVTKRKKSKPWFNCTHSIVVQAGYHSYWAKPVTHFDFFSPRNRCKRLGLIWLCCKEMWGLLQATFSNSNYSSLFKPDGSVAGSPYGKATIFYFLFLGNSTLDDSDLTDFRLSRPLPFFHTVKFAGCSSI